MLDPSEFKDIDPGRRVLLGPGPSDVPARVLQALSAPCVGHLDPYFLAIMDETQRPEPKQLATVFAQYGIRSNCLSLGGLRETAVPDSLFFERYCKRTPMGRLAEGRDVKGPVVFLASDASCYVTGTNVVVDGGWTAW